MPRRAGSYVALCHFDAKGYGIEYLDLSEGDKVEILDAPRGEVADDGWTFGAVKGRGEGWFPTDFIGAEAPQDHISPTSATSWSCHSEELPSHMKKVFHVALADFHAEEYGTEYVSLHRGARVELLRASEASDEEWSYGSVCGHGVGWFPTQFIWRVWPSWAEVQAELAASNCQEVRPLQSSLPEKNAGLDDPVAKEDSARHEAISQQTHGLSNLEGNSTRFDVGVCMESAMPSDSHELASYEVEPVYNSTKCFSVVEAAEENEPIEEPADAQTAWYLQDGSTVDCYCIDEVVDENEATDSEPEDPQFAWYSQEELPPDVMLEGPPGRASESTEFLAHFQEHPLDNVSAGKINALHNNITTQYGIRGQKAFSIAACGVFNCNYSWSASLDNTVSSGAVVATSGSKKRASAEAHRVMLWKAGLATLNDLLVDSVLDPEVIHRLGAELISKHANTSNLSAHSAQMSSTRSATDFFETAVGRRIQYGNFACWSTVALEIRNAALNENSSQDSLAALASDAVVLAEGGDPRTWQVAFPPLFERIVWHCDGSFISGLLDRLKDHCDERLPPRVWGSMMDAISRCPDDFLTNCWLDVLSCQLRCDTSAFDSGRKAATFMSCRSWLAREGHAELRQVLDPRSGADWIPIHTQFEVDSIDSASSSLTISTPANVSPYLLKELPEARDYIVITSEHDYGQRLLGMVSKIGSAEGRRTFRMNPSVFQEDWSRRVQDWQVKKHPVNVMALNAFGTSHRRMETALTSATSSQSMGKSEFVEYMLPFARSCPGQDLHNLIFSMDVTDMVRQWPTCESSCSSSSLCNTTDLACSRNLQLHPAVLDLTAMQQKAVQLACEQKVTLIQGPPGTGKTNTATRIVEVWHGMVPDEKILCCSDSNAAADNFAAALLKRGIRCIRLGHASDYRNATHLRHLSGYKEYLRFPEDMWRRTRLEGQAIKKFGVVVATCIGSGHDFLQKFDFSRVVIDECTQATLLSTLVPLSLGASHVALLGDHKQLPPTVLDSVACQQGLSRSMFERLIEPHPSWAIMLDVQFRMHPSIAVFPSREFYGGMVSSHESTSQLSCIGGLTWPPNCRRVRHIDVQGMEYSYGTSLQNDEEVKAILELLPQVRLEQADIGVITPYQAQKRLIRRRLRDAGYSAVHADTIDGFQGSERELIIISLVRCNRSGRVGFLQDPRRANVALTRARRGLIVVASRSTLMASKGQSRDADSWSRWAEWMES